jgi:menaquinol-cytochrome c reductase iron-sulfur subunit
MSDQHERTPHEQGEGSDGRRAFLKVGVGALGAGLAAVVVAPALKAVLWPLAADAAVISGGNEFVIVGKRKEFGAAPVRVDIYADRVDAWNRIKNVKIGSAWVVERDGQLHAFSTVCPHLGCSVDYNAETSKFECPCHDSAFGLDGKHEAGPSPRSLDALELDQTGGENESQLISIRYERFKQGVNDKVKVG